MDLFKDFPYKLKTVNFKEDSFYKIGGSTDYFFEPTSIVELQVAINWCKGKTPFTIIGGSTNIIFSENLPVALYISLNKLNKYKVIYENDYTIIKAQAGVENNTLTAVAQENNYIDLTFITKLPGTIGGGTKMNARAYGKEYKDVITEVTVLNEKGELVTINQESFFIGYKETIATHNPYIIIESTFILKEKATHENINNKAKEIMSDRENKHHFDHPCCGSVFKNNYTIGIPSGAIFDKAGMKGFQIGGAKVSNFHANFIYNIGSATSEDVLTIAQKMLLEAQKLGFTGLELELQLIGTFKKNICQTFSIEHTASSDLNLVETGFWHI